MTVLYDHISNRDLCIRLMALSLNNNPVCSLLHSTPKNVYYDVYYLTKGLLPSFSTNEIIEVLYAWGKHHSVLGNKYFIEYLEDFEQTVPKDEEEGVMHDECNRDLESRMKREREDQQVGIFEFIESADVRLRLRSLMENNMALHRLIVKPILNDIYCEFSRLLLCLDSYNKFNRIDIFQISHAWFYYHDIIGHIINNKKEDQQVALEDESMHHKAYNNVLIHDTVSCLIEISTALEEGDEIPGLNTVLPSIQSLLDRITYQNSVKQENKNKDKDKESNNE